MDTYSNSNREQKGELMPGYIAHDFYCIKCGNKNFAIPRKQGNQRGKFHRKKLYCVHCKATINCIECRNEEEVAEFKEAFERGEFKDEAEESLLNCGDSRLG